MTDEFAALVERQIDSAIRSFDPEEAASFDHWNSELQRLENMLLKELPADHNLIASVLAHRVHLAAEVARVDLVLELSSRFVATFSASHPSFSNVALLRVRALHFAEDHVLEIAESLALARMPEIQKGEYVSLLEHLAIRHPGSIPLDEQLSAKLSEALLELSAQGYESLAMIASNSLQLEEAVLCTASELRRANQAKAADLLSDRLS